MAELGLKGVSLSFGGHPLLDGVNLQIEKGERIGLLGRNGCGKSTLLRLLSGELEPDEGEVVRRAGLRASWLAQEVPDSTPGTVSEHLNLSLAGVELEGAWEAEKRIEEVVRQLALDPSAPVAELSAGSKRRAMLAAALAAAPDVLLLDEPTNHLDIETIANLEDLLQRRSGTLVFVTHDRAFLRRLATRILDLDRGVLRSYDCDYATYLDRKEAELEAERGEFAEFDKKLAKEEAWIRRGIRARRTRNMGRVRALQTLRRERAARREETGRVKARLQEAERTGQVVIRAKKLSHSFGDKPILRNFSTEIQRGDRIGIIGPNGCGKTTLLRVLLGELEPDAGNIHHGTNLEIARFDQLHSVLDPKKTLQENVCDDGDMVTIGSRSRHVMGYLQDFLFTPEQIRGAITHLSGGERNRLQLARILARPCNVLVLDEPTNDLDVETLELLEELLAEFEGTLLLVSHDRAFLENVVTSVLVFEEGGVNEYLGGYEDWQRVRAARGAAEVKSTKPKPARRSENKPRKLTFKEKLELEELPVRIETLEGSKDALEATMADPAFYRRDGTEIASATNRLRELTDELAAAYDRWELLEGIASTETR